MAVDTHYWKESGQADTVFTTAGNWTSGIAPTAGDHIVFNAGSAACAGSDQRATTLGTTTVTSGYSGLLGSSGAYLQLDTTKIVFGGQGTANYIVNDPNATGAQVIVTSTGSGADALHLDCPAGATNGLFASCIILKGNVTIDAGAEIEIGATITVGHSGTTNTDAVVAIGAGVVETDDTVISGDLTQYGGTVTCASAHGTHNMYAGIFTHTVGNITATNLFNGTYNWSATGTTPTITTLTQYGGTFSAAGASGSTPTLSNVVLYDGNLNLNNGATVTLTASIISYDATPSITATTGKTWAIS